MTTFFYKEQEQTQLTKSTTLLTSASMPSFYPTSRNRTLIAKHLAQRNDDDDDDDTTHSIYKDALIIQIFQHWKIKTIEHQQALNNANNLHMTHHFSRALATTPSSIQTANVENTPPEFSSSKPKDEGSITVEPEKPLTTMRRRPLQTPASHIRRKESLKQISSSTNDLINPNLLAPGARHRSRATAPATKPSNKPPPIFIAPKKTQPSAPPRLSTLASDESNQIKRRLSSEKISAFPDDPNVPTMPSTWAPAPPTVTPRFFLQSPRHSLDDDDDGTSSDDCSRESLLIRNKNPTKSPIRTREKYQLSPHIIIPAAVIIIDPDGHPYLYDLNNQSLQELVDPLITPDNDIIPTDAKTKSNSTTVPDNFALHSIGEEEEDSIEKNTRNGVILSKELDRIEAFSRSRQTPTSVENNEIHTERTDEHDQTRLGRRWSDGIFSDDDDRHSQTPLIKVPSATSVMKSSVNHPPKVSKTKYFLMKLHLSSSSKDEDSNKSASNLPPAPRRRTVRRATDKTRYQTR